jgi:hypothetical protein
MLGDRRIQGRGAGDHAIGLDLHRAEGAARELQHHARHAAISHDQVRRRAQNRQRHRIRQVAQQQRQVVEVGRPHQPLRRPADAEPGGGRERRLRLHAPAQRGEGGVRRHAGLTCCRPRCAAACGLQRGQLVGRACAQAVMLPAPRQTT